MTNPTGRDQTPVSNTVLRAPYGARFCRSNAARRAVRHERRVLQIDEHLPEHGLVARVRTAPQRKPSGLRRQRVGPSWRDDAVPGVLKLVARRMRRAEAAHEAREHPNAFRQSSHKQW
jgi:hypothetical protein